MAKIKDIRSGEEYENQEELTRAEKRMLRQARKAAGMSAGGKVAKFLKQAIVIILTLVLIGGAALAILYRDELNVDGLKRMVTYLSLERDEDGQAEEIFYNSSTSNCYAQVDNALLVASNSSIQLFSQSGKSYVSKAVSMENPAVHSAGSYGVAFDLGGTGLYMFEGRQLAYEKTTEGKILNARMNANGYLTLLTKETGYKGVVTVYDSGDHARVQVRISSTNVMDALVSDDGKTLAIVTIGTKSGQVCSVVSFYDVSTGEVLEDASYDLTATVPLDFRWDGDGVILQVDDGIRYVSVADGLTATWSNPDEYLRGFAFTDQGYQVMIWSKYQTGYQGSIMLVDFEGNLISEVSIDQQVYSISSTGSYIALLYTNELVIYTGNLEEYASLVDTAGARQVLMRKDGSTLLLGTESATLYMP